MKAWVAAAADVTGIVVFAAVGRASHHESVGPVGLAGTAWPFLVGWAVGALAGRAWRRPEALGTGTMLAASAVAGGMLLRAATGAGVQPSFVVVASIVLAILLLGWRTGVLRAGSL